MVNRKTINYITVFKTSLLFALFCVTSLFAQKKHTGFKITNTNVRTVETTGFVRCATVEYGQKMAEENPEKPSEEVFESWMSAKISQRKTSRANGKIAAQVYNIPVVIHVIHNGDEINSEGNIVGENISDAQAQSQIEVLNQDFRKKIGTPGGINSTGAAVDVEINFCLAQQDPYGLETTGIIRHNITPYNDEVDNESTLNVGGGGVDWETYADVQKMKKETQWDPEKYLNIWTIRTGGESVEDGGLDDLLGFAQFPSNSGLQGLNISGGLSTTDGVVVSFHAFGDSNQSDGSFIMNNRYNEGRTTTHEVGHWLGLRHIWGDPNNNEDGCDVDDYCLDTPNTKEANTVCNTIDSCPADGFGNNDMVQNYMDYTTDPCMDTFTQDQKDRMVAVMENSPRRVELINSPGCDPPLYTDDDLSAFLIDPNPVTDFVKIVGFANDVVKISMFDVYGKVVFSERYNDIDTVFSQELNFDELASGVYIVLIENGSKKVVKRIIKK